MAALTETHGSDTISTTERSFMQTANYSSGSPLTDDTIARIRLWFVSIAAGDQFEIKVYEKINGTQRLARSPIQVVGAQSSATEIDLGEIGEGWDVTAKRIAGSDRTLDWQAWKVTA